MELDKKKEFEAAPSLSCGRYHSETIVGLTCPLTVLENMFRDVDYSLSFIPHWVAQILYWDLPSQVFIFIYSVCLGWVLILWRICPPIEKIREVY